MKIIKNEKDSSQFIGQTVEVKIDRPLGSKHPKWGFEYPVNYGYIPDTKAADGDELDAYVLGVEEPIETFLGKAIAMIHRLNDNDDKLIVTDGEEFDDDEIRDKTNFQEQWFESEIFREEKMK